MKPALFCGSLLLAVGGCGGGSTGPSGGPDYPGSAPNPGGTSCPARSLCLRADTFDPLSLNISSGTNVAFVNSSGVEHNVVFSNDPGVANIGLFASGTVNRTFSKQGTFTAECLVHYGMTASITVQ